MSRYRLESLSFTLLREYAWCPRSAFFKLHGLWEPPTWSMEAARYDPARIEAILARHGIQGRLLLEQYLESPSLGLRGRVDAVIVGDEEAVPVEAKRRTGRRRRYIHHRLEAAAYCIAAEETLEKQCRRVLIVSVGDGKVNEVRVDARLRRQVEHAVEQLWVIARGVTLPEATRQRQRCSSCFYRSICPASRTRM